MRKLCAGLIVLTLAGCASTQAARPGGQDAAAKENCTRFDAAARAYSKGLNEYLNPIKMQEVVITRCGNGDAPACVSVPFAIPFFAIFDVMITPVLFPILLASVNHYQCPQQPEAPSEGATTSDTQPGGMEPPEEAPE